MDLRRGPRATRIPRRRGWDDDRDRVWGDRLVWRWNQSVPATGGPVQRTAAHQPIGRHRRTTPPAHSLQPGRPQLRRARHRGRHEVPLDTPGGGTLRRLVASSVNTPAGRQAIAEIATGDLVICQRTHPTRRGDGDLVGICTIGLTDAGNDAETGQREHAACLIPLTKFTHPVPRRTAQRHGRLRVESLCQGQQLPGRQGPVGFGLSDVEDADAVELLSVCGIPPEALTEPDNAHLAAQLRATDTGNPLFHKLRYDAVLRPQVRRAHELEAERRALESGPPTTATSSTPMTGHLRAPQWLRPAVRRRRLRRAPSRGQGVPLPAALPRCTFSPPRRNGPPTRGLGPHPIGGCSPSSAPEPRTPTSRSAHPTRSWSCSATGAFRSTAAGPEDDLPAPPPSGLRVIDDEACTADIPHRLTVPRCRPVR